MTDYTVGDTVHFMFTTRRFSTGAPFALAGTPAVSAYENEGTTQITAGITLGVDHDGVTGLNLVTVVASGANGFEAGKDYHLVITAGTVDSVSVVGEVVGRFTLSRSAAAVDLANGTDGLGAIKAETALILADTGTDGVVVASLAANSITAAAIANGAIDAATFAADVDAEILSYIVDDATRIDASALNTASVTSIPAILDDTGTAGVVVASIAANAVSASALATDAVSEIADGILNRDMSTGTDSGSASVRTMRQALRFLRNKWSISGTTLTVCKEDDSTSSWTSELTGTAAADPITASDPAS